MLAVMAWSEEQKAVGRVELARRREFETPATYRKSFLRASAGGLGCLFLILLANSTLHHKPALTTLLSAIALLLISLVAFALLASLAYVRFLDWRRPPTL